MPTKAALNAAICLALLFLTAPAFPQKNPIQIKPDKVPQINSTQNGDKDYMLKQFDDEVEENRRLFASGKSFFPSFYAYTAADGDNLFDLASRFCLRYDSVCIINGITAYQCHLCYKSFVQKQTLRHT